ncbi:LOW QUALITY PROTEIN: hypothetical protein KUTeg_010636 [Tegillarca granosa]|uniref:C2H2-type domain-containing protein n=1 Tax=Tegillarca granosa TaxID=220873 RepID=A0ABQ9F348_TEGGR|nr:LOW QUALITY PROTEIN: hypothetical protein KUTeg_010636 [Tegillarca granosa]
MPWGPYPAPWENKNGTVDEALREFIQQLMQFTEDISRREQHVFRLNLVFGVILQHRETLSYKYVRPYNNYTVLDTPIYISKTEDLRKLNRPDTKSIPVLLTNVVFTIYSTHYPLGIGIVPDYLRNHHAIVPLEHTGQNYNNSLCAFRCLAAHRGYDVKCLEGAAHEHNKQWSSDDITFFQGISFYEFPKFEETFQVNLEVYSLHKNEWAKSIYKSMGRYTDTMYLNMHEHHLSYIKDFAGYAKKFQCKSCERHFNMIKHLHVHQRICNNKTIYANESIFEKLEQFGIVVPDTERIFPWSITYDMEYILERRGTPKGSSEPKSMFPSVNVEGYTQPQCIVDPDQEQLTDEFIQALQTIAEEVKHLARAKWG